MKKETTSVRSHCTLRVRKVSYSVYETIEEAIRAIGRTNVLRAINQSVKLDKIDRVRMKGVERREKFDLLCKSLDSDPGPGPNKGEKKK